MKTSQSRRAVEYRCVINAHLTGLSDRSGDHSQTVSCGWSVDCKTSLSSLQSGCVEPAECQSLQIADAHDLTWQ